MERPVAKVLGLVVVAGLLFALVSNESGRIAGTPAGPIGEVEEAAPGTVDPAVQALTGGLAVGDDLASWKVVSIIKPYRKLARVEVERDGTRFSIGIARKGSTGKLPPIETVRYELGVGYFSGESAKDKVPKPDAAAEALADRIRKVEEKVPVPAGM